MHEPLHTGTESYIREDKGAIPFDLCERIINTFEKDVEGQEKGETGFGYHPDRKVSTDLNITTRTTKKPDLWSDIDAELFKCVDAGFIKFIEDVEAFRYATPPFGDTGYYIQKYNTDKGFFKPHFDASHAGICKHVATCIMYLNTVDEGGETSFPAWGVDVKPEAGKMLWYPSAVTHVHEGKQPISNAKYIITSFMMYSGVMN